MLLTAYLGVHVTLHPAESDTAAQRYKMGFAGCAIVACCLIGLQAYRSNRTQAGLLRQLAKIEHNTSEPPKVQIINSIPPPQVIITSQSYSELIAARKLALKKRLIALSREILDFDGDYLRKGPHRLDDPHLTEYGGVWAAKAYNDRFKVRVRRICKEVTNAGLNVEGLDSFEAVDISSFPHVSQALAALAEKL